MCTVISRMTKYSLNKYNIAISCKNKKNINLFYLEDSS